MVIQEILYVETSTVVGTGATMQKHHHRIGRITKCFTMQLRAVCGLPLGSTEFCRPAAMVNLLGDIWEGGEPRWDRAIETPGVKLHLYGKAEPRPGRKMGHITALAETAEAAVKLAAEARMMLRKSS